MGKFYDFRDDFVVWVKEHPKKNAVTFVLGIGAGLFIASLS